MYMSSTKNVADSGSMNNKTFLLKLLETDSFGNITSTIASTLITGIFTAYISLTLSDKFLSHQPGSAEEKERLEKEKVREKYRALGWAKGLWTYIFPKKESQE